MSKSLQGKFEALCTPAQIYLLLALLSCIIALFSNVNFLAIFVKLIFAVIWTFILNWICQKGYSGLSWFLVVFPYVVILLMVLAMSTSSSSSSFYGKRNRR
jgi:hypothetical protein